MVRRRIKYRSILEERIAYGLVYGDYPFAYESERFKYIIPESKHTYTPDFRLEKNNDGFVFGYIYIECKGGGPRYGLTKSTKEKMLCMKEQWPQLDIRFVFENAYLETGLGRGRKKGTYADWAELHNFKWSHRVIPTEWLQELYPNG